MCLFCFYSLIAHLFDLVVWGFCVFIVFIFFSFVEFSSVWVCCFMMLCVCVIVFILCLLFNFYLFEFLVLRICSFCVYVVIMCSNFPLFEFVTLRFWVFCLLAFVLFLCSIYSCLNLLFEDVVFFIVFICFSCFECSSVWICLCLFFNVLPLGSRRFKILCFYCVHVVFIFWIFLCLNLLF